tara:strand:+ start:850 stop:1473 length:624 start_codon:yes stop_codon:yes gene_type:complete
MPLVSNTILKTYMPELAQGSGADTELTALLDRVEVAVARYLGFPFSYDGTQYHNTLTVQTYTLYYDGPSMGNHLMLDLRIKPVHSITSIHSDPYQEYESDTLIDPNGYNLDNVKGQVRLKPKTAVDVFDKGDRAIKVVLTAGYTSDSIPPELEHAICVWASQLQRNKQNQGRETVSQRGGSTNLSPKTMPIEVKEYLKPYRLSGTIL